MASSADADADADAENSERAAEDAMAAAAAAAARNRRQVPPYSAPAGNPERPRVRYSSVPLARSTERPYSFARNLKRAASAVNPLRLPVPQLQNPRTLFYNTLDITDLYTFGSVLGYGSLSVIYKVTKIDTRIDYACQQFRKAVLEFPSHYNLISRQIECLRRLSGNPDVVEIMDIFENDHIFSIVMELLEGKLLKYHLFGGRCFDEVKAAQVFKTILRVIRACHSERVLHRGITPENFNLSQRGGRIVVKATGFKLSVPYNPGTVVSEKVGNLAYWSPEVLNGSYGLEADIWSAGVLLYLMLCGVFPFKGGSESEISQAIFMIDPKFDYGPWLSMSETAIDLIGKMLCSKSERWTVSQLLDHPWMRGQDVGPAGNYQTLDPPLLFRFKEFAKMNNFKRLAMREIARSLSKMNNKESIAGLLEQEYPLLEQEFKSMDSSKIGSVSSVKLKATLLKDDPVLEDSEFSYLMDAVVLNSNHCIDYLEFIAATIDPKKLNDGHLWPTYLYFADGHELISAENLQMRFSEQGRNIEIFKDVDFGNDGYINYSKFAYMMDDKHSVSVPTTDSCDTPNNLGSSGYNEPNILTDHPGSWIYCVCLMLYIIVGCIVYLLMQHFSHESLFTGGRTSIVDALYFVVSIISTVGYGDIVPVNVVSKLITVLYLLVGLFLMSAAFVVISQAITNFEDRFCGKILRRMGRTCGRIWLSFFYCTVCTVLGILTLYKWEKMRGFQPVYVSIASITTLGFGDSSFKSPTGRLLGSLWLLPSTIFVLRLTSIVADWLISLYRNPLPSELRPGQGDVGQNKVCAGN